MYMTNSKDLMLTDARNSSNVLCFDCYDLCRQTYPLSSLTLNSMQLNLTGGVKPSYVAISQVLQEQNNE